MSKKILIGDMGLLLYNAVLLFISRILYDNKILLQKPVDDDGYSLIGGHVEAMETTEETLIREFKEEMQKNLHV